MNILRLLPVLLLTGVAVGQESTPAPASEAAAAARRQALEIAGAFANDGYRLRDGFVAGTIETGKPLLYEVSLFVGNEYWFVGSAGGSAPRLKVSLHGASGDPVEFQDYADGASAAAGIEPDVSGTYFVRVELVEGEKAPFCLVYSYK